MDVVYVLLGLAFFLLSYMPCPVDRAFAIGGAVMVWAYILGGITTVGLLIYLLIALLKPEKF